MIKNGRTLWRLMAGSVAICIASVALTGCGGHSGAAGKPAHYISRESDDDELDNVLKFDSRVDSYEKDGERLIIHVNDSWTSSPPGIQEFALGQWLQKWHSNNGDEVVVQSSGDDVARASTEHGIEFVKRAVEEEEGS